MKQIETLLQRYRNGEITPEEQAELNRLTHRDEILNAAASRAAKIRRQRTTVVSSVASVVIVAAVFLTITANNSTPTADTPLLAQNVIEVNEAPAQPQIAPLAAPTESSKPTVSTMTEKPVSAPKKAAETVIEHNNTAQATPINAVSEVKHTEPSASLDPVVACNTQCSPDSVINDIWNFLKA